MSFSTITRLAFGMAVALMLPPSQATEELQKGISQEVIECPDDYKECPGGHEVRREPSLGCNFPTCELKCCDPLKMPQFFEGGNCCGATGEWIGSWGDGVTFTCNGVTSMGPDYPPPFGKPCPVKCQDVKGKGRCRKLSPIGCRWFYGDRTCVHEDDKKCPEIGRKRNCKKFDKCKWKSKKCLPRCAAPRADKPCTKEHRPVKCGECEYSNLCVALGAGHRKFTCKRVCRNDQGCSKGEVCYKKLDQKCNRRLDKKCSGVCVQPTGNKCNGFIGTTCPFGERCIDHGCPEGVMDCGGICIDDDRCRKPRKNTCSKEFNPVICGECKYDNLCLAKAARKSEAQCKGFCPWPPAHLQCGPAHFPPFKCGDYDCQYDSLCLAKHAGFEEGQCEKDCSDERPCPLAPCPVGHKHVTPPNQCCPVCTPDGKTDCSKVLCPEVIRCPQGQTPSKKPGECCNTCIKDPFEKPDCSLVRCAYPQCGIGETAHTPTGHCCPICSPCLTACAYPNCPEDEEAVSVPGECCPVCEKFLGTSKSLP